MATMNGPETHRMSEGDSIEFYHGGKRYVLGNIRLEQVVRDLEARPTEEDLESKTVISREILIGRRP